MRGYRHAAPAGAGERRLRSACRFIGGGETEVRSPEMDEGSSGESRRVLLDGGERGALPIDRALLDAMAGRRLVERRGDFLALTAAGRAFSTEKKVLRGDGFSPRARDIDGRVVDAGAGAAIVPVNVAESPLAQLARLKARDGAPFLSAEEWQAGERLRVDFTRGQMLPRLGANWEASVTTGRRHGGGGVADLTDAALAARLRVERALAAVGPELSGVLVDMCCFLKGIETVEFERGWPARSAKLMLKTALAALARHYRPPAPAKGPRMLHWGTEDFRPRIG